MADSKEDRFVQRLNFGGDNLALSWKTFKAQFAVVKIAKKYADMGAEEQIANLLLLMGSDSVPIFNQFTFNEEVEGQKRTLDNVIAMFDRHFEPVKNVIFERVKFNSIKQGTQSIHQFITQLQSQADNCDYGDMREEMIRDRIVVGVSDDKLREYLIDVEDLDLARCIRKSKQYVSHHAQAARLACTHVGEENLDAVRPSRGTNYARSNEEGKQDKSNSERRQGAMGKEKPRCEYCNRAAHHRDRCPARNSICHRCKNRGHWARAKACRSVNKARTDEVACEEELEGLFLGTSDSE